MAKSHKDTDLYGNQVFALAKGVYGESKVIGEWVERAPKRPKQERIKAQTILDGLMSMGKNQVIC